MSAGALTDINSCSYIERTYMWSNTLVTACAPRNLPPNSFKCSPGTSTIDGTYLTTAISDSHDGEKKRLSGNILKSKISINRILILINQNHLLNHDTNHYPIHAQKQLKCFIGWSNNNYGQSQISFGSNWRNVYQPYVIKDLRCSDHNATTDR